MRVESIPKKLPIGTTTTCIPGIVHFQKTSKWQMFQGFFGGVGQENGVKVFLHSALQKKQYTPED